MVEVEGWMLTEQERDLRPSNLVREASGAGSDRRGMHEMSEEYGRFVVFPVFLDPTVQRRRS